MAARPSSEQSLHLPHGILGKDALPFIREQAVFRGNLERAERTRASLLIPRQERVILELPLLKQVKGLPQDRPPTGFRAAVSGPQPQKGVGSSPFAYGQLGNLLEGHGRVIKVLPLIRPGSPQPGLSLIPRRINDDATVLPGVKRLFGRTSLPTFRPPIGILGMAVRQLFLLR